MNKKYLLFSGITAVVTIGGLYLRRLYEQSIVLTEIEQTYGKTKITKIGDQQVSIVTELILTNRSALNAKIKGGRIEMFIDGKYMGVVQFPQQKITIKSGGQTIIPLKMTFDTSNVLSSALGNLLGVVLGSQNPKNTMVELKGTLRVGVGIFMFNYDFYDKSSLESYISGEQESVGQGASS
jgi:hypothetical protein